MALLLAGYTVTVAEIDQMLLLAEWRERQASRVWHAEIAPIARDGFATADEYLQALASVPAWDAVVAAGRTRLDLEQAHRLAHRYDRKEQPNG